MTARRDAAPDPAPKNSPFAGLRDRLGSLPSGPEPSIDEPQKTGASDSREPVRLRREKAGRGGKTVVAVEGPGLLGRDLELVAKQIAKGLGTRARVEGESIAVQGELGDRLEAWLREHGFADVRRSN